MLNKTEPLELIASGESSTVEFMRDEVSLEALAKAPVAPEGFRGGHVFLGVEDDGTVYGVRRADLEHWVTDTGFEHHGHPAIDAFQQATGPPSIPSRERESSRDRKALGAVRDRVSAGKARWSLDCLV